MHGRKIQKKWGETPSLMQFSYCKARRQSKYDWAGITMGAAFNHNLAYPLRLKAQQLFYQAVKESQSNVVSVCNSTIDSHNFKPAVKAQIGPCYTTYPASIAAYASIGLSAYMEFKNQIHQKILSVHLATYLENPARQDKVNVDPNIYQLVANTVTQWVETRLLLEELYRTISLDAVEIYRLFSAAQENLRFKSLPEMLRVVILYGDILPDWQQYNLHPFTKQLLNVLTKTSEPFFSILAKGNQSDLVTLGINWVHALCMSISVYLPLGPEDQSKTENKEGENPSLSCANYCWQEINKPTEAGLFSPLNELSPPLLHDPTDVASYTLQSLNSGSINSDADNNNDSAKIMTAFSKTIEQAGRPDNTWQDMRSDMLEETMRRLPFTASPIEGSPSEGHQVSAYGNIGSGETIFDNVVELSDDLTGFDQLIAEAEPITAALKKNLYPNVEHLPITQTLCTSGSLDPNRLALGNISSTIFKRYRMKERSDPRGNPVLVIACDGSASLNSSQMKMVKLLTAAYLGSTMRNGIQLLTCLYHSGTVRQGIYGPLVRWIYHPLKTPVANPKEAISCIVNLPDYGTGGQSDALSVAFIMDEAKHLARGSMIYFVLITDTAWNRSFKTEKSGKEEMEAFFIGAYEDLGKKLHFTLVSLGGPEETGFEDKVDAVIKISSTDLAHCNSVAEKIGLHVAQCIRERGRHAAGQ